MTTDYSKLDTAALVAAADALMAEITPGAWDWWTTGYGRTGLASVVEDGKIPVTVLSISNGYIKSDDADAAFIAAAPALVRALVTRLRESVSNG